MTDFFIFGLPLRIEHCHESINKINRLHGLGAFCSNTTGTSIRGMLSRGDPG